MADGPAAGPAPAPAPAVSVVVPTRDPGPEIARSLAALEAQTMRSALEIIVVDDGSHTVDAIDAALARFSHVRLTRAPRRGIAAARNVGALAARGSIVCFTDDDCEAQPDWAARLADVIRSGADAVGGPTVTGRPENLYDAATQAIVNCVAELSDARPSFLPGSNFACRREVLLANPFDESFINSGEDREWCARLLRLGYRLGSEETAVVRHYQDLSFRSFWHKHLRYGCGAYLFMRSQGSGRRLGPPGRYRKLASRSFEAGLRIGLLTCVAELATAVGFAQEMARGLRSGH